MVKIAVILAGCGYLDGSEIREAVITLLELDKANVTYECFAPDIEQHHVINHLTGKEMPEKRNVLIEAARIARGKIQSIDKIKVDDFAAVIMPGGYGVAKNLSDIAFRGKDGTATPIIKSILQKFLSQKKPIGAICIAPAILVAAIKDKTSPTVTIGDDNDNLISGLGGKHQHCKTTDIIFDKDNNIVSCSAYMRNDALKDIATGIAKLVQKIVSLS